MARNDGDSTLYKGKRIAVPLRWVAKSEPQGAMVSKLPLTVLTWDKAELSYITFSKVATAPNQTVEQRSNSFAAVFWTYLAGNRTVTGPVKITSASEEVVCMKAVSPKDPAHVEVACLFPEAGLSATFLGENEDEAVFYQLIRRLR